MMYVKCLNVWIIGFIYIENNKNKLKYMLKYMLLFL